MRSPEIELKQLRELCPVADLRLEAGKPIVVLPGLQFRVGKTRQTRDVLLWPWERDSYNTRLFLSAPVEAANAQNWTVFNIQGRTWHACSWRGVASSLPWIEILANHLRAFR